MRYIYTKPKEERPYFFPHIKRIVQIHQLGIKLNAFLNMSATPVAKANIGII